MDKPVPKLVRLVLVLAGISVSLPIVCEYEMGFYLLLWLAVWGNWRLARLGRADDDPFMATAASALRPIHWGVVSYVVILLLCAVLGSFFSDYARPLGKSLSVWSHMGSKLGLQWFVLSAGVLAATRRGWNPRRMAPWLLAWLVVHFVYCYVQRSTGIDWTHGLHAVLGQHRFAYGVYRVSGFMGHPLNLAYNLELLLLAAVALALRLPAAADRDDRWVWWGVAGVTALTLLISGSRFVLGAVVLVLLCTEGRRALRHWPWVLAGAVAMAGALYLEGSVLGRFGELFAQDVPLLERFPRLLHWKMHWLMFVDHPLLGVTMAAGDDPARAYYTAAGVRDNLYSAHNVFLQSLADTGLLGTAGLLGLLAGLLISLRRLSRLGAQGTGYVIGAAILTGLMQNDLRDSEFIYAFWFLLSLLLVQSAVLSARRRPDERDGDQRKPPEDLEPAAGRADPA